MTDLNHANTVCQRKMQDTEFPFICKCWCTVVHVFHCGNSAERGSALSRDFHSLERCDGCQLTASSRRQLSRSRHCELSAELLKLRRHSTPSQAECYAPTEHESCTVKYTTAQ